MSLTLLLVAELIVSEAPCSPAKQCVAELVPAINLGSSVDLAPSARHLPILSTIHASLGCRLSLPNSHLIRRNESAQVSNGLTY